MQQLERAAECRGDLRSLHVPYGSMCPSSVCVYTYIHTHIYIYIYILYIYIHIYIYGPKYILVGHMDP